MSSIIQILRRIGGIKAAPTSGSAGQLALWKAGSAPTDAASLYAHDGAQWTELLDTSAQWTVKGADIYRAAGKVGIGTNAPSAALTVKSGDIELDGGGTHDPIITIKGAKGASAHTYAFGADGNGTIYLFDQTASRYLLNFTKDGNLGLANNDPKCLVDARGNCLSTHASIVSRATSTSGISGIGAIEFMFDSNFVGTMLHQYGTGATGSLYGSPAASAGELLFQNCSVGYIATNGAASIAFAVGAAERHRIDGATGAFIFGGVKTVYADGSYGCPPLQWHGRGGSNAGAASSVDVTTALSHIVFRNPNGVVGRIETNGSATAYLTSSDYRLKENLAPLTDAAARLAKIPVHRFNFKTDPGKTVDGFLAHEVQAIVPEAVSGDKDAVDADGKPNYQAIDQSKLVPLLMAALQDALKRIEALEARP